MDVLSGPLRLARVACIALAFVVRSSAGAAGAAELPKRIVPSYRGIAYDRLTLPVAVFRNALPAPRPRLIAGLAPSGPRYGIIDLGHDRYAPAGATRIPVAINRAGRILLDDYLPHAEGGTLGSSALILNANAAGTSVALYAVCPACDPTPRSQSAFNALALNDAGDVVGLWNDFLPGNAPDGRPPAYDLTYFVRWAPSGQNRWSVAQLGFGTRDAAYAVNNEGIAAGQDGTFAARFSNNGYAVDLGTLSETACDARATAINDAGTIAGFACAGESSVAVIFPSRGPAQPLAARASPSAAEAIDAAGDIAGFAGDAAVVWTAGHTTYLPSPFGFAGTHAVAYALNVAHDVVGDVYYSDRGSQAVGGFLYTRGRTYFLDTLLPPNSGWRIVHVTGINDSGDIIGVGLYRRSPAPFVLRRLSR